MIFRCVKCGCECDYDEDEDGVFDCEECDGLMYGDPDGILRF